MKFDGLTLYGALKRGASEPRGPALLYMGTEISYERVLSEVDKIADFFAASGIKAGEPVTLCMPNLPQCVICFYALNKIGAVAHMVHPLAPEEMLKGYMDAVGSKTLALTDIFAEKYSSLAGQVKTLLCSPADHLGAVRRTVFSLMNGKKLRPFRGKENVVTYRDALRGKYPAAVEHTDENAPAVYLHSGGTSGEPKTIVLSSRAVNALCANGYEILGITEFHGGSMLAVLPMFHGFGLAMGIHAMICHGGTNALMPKFHTRETIDLIAKNKINYLIGVPVLYEALLKKPDFSGEKLKNLRIAFVGGDYVPKKLLADFNARMEQYGSSARLYEGYGLTETVTVCAVNTDAFHRDGSVGKALRGMEITAFSDSLEPLPAGETGELCVAGDELMLGYLSDPEDTAKVFFERDGKRYVRTGDLGSVDADGFVFFKSRIKRIAKVSGVPVFPSEIERLVMDECEFVAEAAAAVVPDPRTGSAIRLFIVLANPDNNNSAAGSAPAVTGNNNDNSTAEPDTRNAAAFATAATAGTGTVQNVASERLREIIGGRLGPYAVPREIRYVDAFPKTLVGKVDFKALEKTN